MAYVPPHRRANSAPTGISLIPVSSASANWRTPSSVSLPLTPPQSPQAHRRTSWQAGSSTWKGSARPLNTRPRCTRPALNDFDYLSEWLATDAYKKAQIQAEEWLIAQAPLHSLLETSTPGQIGVGVLKRAARDLAKEDNFAVPARIEALLKKSIQLRLWVTDKFYSGKGDEQHAHWVKEYEDFYLDLGCTPF